MKEDREKCDAAGFDGFLSKPLDKPVFIETLSRYLTVVTSKEGDNEIILPDIDLSQEEIFLLTEKYISHLPLRIQEINDELAKRNLLKIKQLTHDLKGTSGNFGYSKLSSICQAIQVEIFNTCHSPTSCELDNCNDDEMLQIISDLVTKLNDNCNIIVNSWNEKYSKVS